MIQVNPTANYPDTEMDRVCGSEVTAVKCVTIGTLSSRALTTWFSETAARFWCKKREVSGIRSLTGFPKKCSTRISNLVILLGSTELSPGKHWQNDIGWSKTHSLGGSYLRTGRVEKTEQGLGFRYGGQRRKILGLYTGIEMQRLIKGNHKSDVSKLKEESTQRLHSFDYNYNI